MNFETDNWGQPQADDVTRPLPHALGFEKSVLSNLIQDPQEFIPLALAESLTAEHFYLPAHSALFSILLERFNAGKEIELVSLTQNLLDTGLLDRIGGPSALADIYGYAPTSVSFRSHVDGLLDKFMARELIRLANDTTQAVYDSPDEISQTRERMQREFAKLDSGRKSCSLVVSGVNDYPTETPLEDVILGNGWGRRGDIITAISTAGNGKSVAMIQGAMSWGIGLPYLGIHPARPLRILLFSGEDDGVTIGQCREGFLEHSEAITGRQLTAQDLEPLDSMVRIEFSREHVGERFHLHLENLLREAPADLVIINPLLSYVGGEIVACASEWLRAGLMPILQRHNCAALIAHHTGKMAKDGWDNTDDTYSAIGGGEMANIPRSILTLRPTAAEGLSVLKVSKRQTTGWKDANGDFTTSYFVKRSGDPTRPAWLPVDSDEAQELLDGTKASNGTGTAGKKANTSHVLKALESGAMQRQALIEWLRRECRCSEKTAITAIRQSESEKSISSFTETNPRGGNPLKWLCLPEHQNQWVK